MMNFRIINQAIINTLGAAAAGQYQVVGYDTGGVSASQMQNSSRIVQSYFSDGDFPKSGGRVKGSKKHQITYTLGLYVSAAAKVNLSVINQEGVAPSAIAAALVALQDGAYGADQLMDELADLVWNVMQNALNYNLGLAPGIMSDAWVEKVKKHEPVPRGSLVVLTGDMTFCCSTVETPSGATPVPMTAGVNVIIDHSGGLGFTTAEVDDVYVPGIQGDSGDNLEADGGDNLQADGG